MEKAEENKTTPVISEPVTEELNIFPVVSLVDDMALAAGLGIAFSGYASAVIKVGIDKLWDVLVNYYSSDRFGTMEEVEKEIRKLERVMTTISNSGLVHEFIGVNDRGMQLWLRKLLDIAFKADNLIDDLHVMFKMESDLKEQKSRIEEIYSKFRESAERRNKTIMEDISKFTNWTEEVLREQRSLVETIQRDGTMRKFGSTMAQTSIYVMDPHVFGRDDEKQHILELIGSNSKNRSLSIVPILGTPGIGKTALARYVFTDSVIDRSFELKTWISLGVEFDLKEITRMILESITGEVCNILSYYKLQDIIHRSLEGKKFLVVLDGVWNENQEDWNKLLGPLFSNRAGSVVLFTTQSPIVASTFGTTEILQLHNLSLEDCGSIFWKQACKEEQLCRDQELQDIGKEIIRRCRGIPVMAKTLGNLLWMKKDKKEWKFILEADTWLLPNIENEVLVGLKLSYFKLPVHLQPCVTYCAIFPRGHTFEKDTMIQLWMAEELLKPNGRVSMEDIGSLYFDELVGRTFFERSTGETSLYTINWLMYDMIQLVAGDSAFRALVDLSSNESPPQNESLVRHLFVVCNEEGGGLQKFQKFKNLRSFSLLSTEGYIIHKLSVEFLESVHCIRVLDLTGSGITELPSSIGKLKLLRYLNLSGTPIIAICQELCGLFMLQTLKLRGCLQLRVLPYAFGNLYNMRVLEIDAERCGLPPGIGNLTMLQELEIFSVRKRAGCALRELHNLLKLRKTLCILGLENVDSVDEADSASLGNKEHLSRLQLEWGQRQDQFENEEKILKNLQPHHNLKELTIRGYLVGKLPNWVWSSPSNLVEVELVDCVNLQCIEELNRLQSLKILRLRGNNVVEEINNGFFGLRVDNVETAFCSLESIHLHSWSVLRSWIRVHDNAFKLLDKIMIHSCPILETLPDFNRFKSLRSLEFENCPELRISQGTRPYMLQHLVYKECLSLGGSSGTSGSRIWPFGWRFFNNRS